MNMFKATQKGFTLLELMIAMAIIGIIASIAVPSYIDYVEKGMAAEATSTLADARIKMEQCYQDTRSYADASCVALCTPSGKNFAFTCSSAPTVNTYTLKATGSGKVSNYSFTVDQANNKTSTYDGTTGNGCWLTTKSGSC